MNETPDPMNNPTLVDAQSFHAAAETLAAEAEAVAAMKAALEEPPSVPAVHMALWVCDLRWPEVTDNAFRLEVPLGAQFKRVYRAKVKERGLYKNVLRMVWLAPTETQRVSFTFALQRMGDVYAVPIVEKAGMLQLGVVDDLDHTPILVWQVPEAASEAAPPAAAPAE